MKTYMIMNSSKREKMPWKKSRKNGYLGQLALFYILVNLYCLLVLYYVGYK